MSEHYVLDAFSTPTYLDDGRGSLVDFVARTMAFAKRSAKCETTAALPLAQRERVLRAESAGYYGCSSVLIACRSSIAR